MLLLITIRKAAGEATVIVCARNLARFQMGLSVIDSLDAGYFDSSE